MDDRSSLNFKPPLVGVVQKISKSGKYFVGFFYFIN